MAELYEVVLIDGPKRWHAGLLADEITETDVLLAEQSKVLLFGSRAALEHYAQELQYVNGNDAVKVAVGKIQSFLAITHDGMELRKSLRDLCGHVFADVDGVVVGPATAQAAATARAAIETDLVGSA